MVPRNTSISIRFLTCFAVVRGCFVCCRTGIHSGRPQLRNIGLTENSGLRSARTVRKWGQEAHSSKAVGPTLNPIQSVKS